MVPRLLPLSSRHPSRPSPASFPGRTCPGSSSAAWHHPAAAPECPESRSGRDEHPKAAYSCPERPRTSDFHDARAWGRSREDIPRIFLHPEAVGIRFAQQTESRGGRSEFPQTGRADRFLVDSQRAAYSTPHRHRLQHSQARRGHCPADRSRRASGGLRAIRSEDINYAGAFVSTENIDHAGTLFFTEDFNHASAGYPKAVITWGAPSRTRVDFCSARVFFMILPMRPPRQCANFTN